MIGALRVRHREFLLERRRRNHGRAQQLADFDRGKAHAAARTVDQEHLARLKFSAIDQRVIRRAVRGEESRRLGLVEIGRQWRELGWRRDDFLGIGAIAHPYDHAIAKLDASNTIGDFRDGARRLHTRRERQVRLELILAGDHEDVGKVDPGGADRDSDLALRQLSRSERFKPQPLGRTKFAADNLFRHYAALAFRRVKASRSSGRRSLPKYMSVLSRKIVGEPNPPRAITSSVFALSASLIDCWPILAKNCCGSMPQRLQTSVKTASCEIS